jgi:DNA polymerase-3 subunit gamma/tau
VRLLDLVSHALESIRDGAEGRIQLELALVKAAAPEVDPSTRALLARIDRLEAALAAGAGSAGRGAESAEVGPAPSPAPAERPAPPPTATRAAAPGAAAAVAAVAQAPEAEPAPELELEELEELWPAVLDALRPETPMLADLLGRGRPVALEGAELTIAFPPECSFLKRQAETEFHRTSATDAARAVTGRSLRLRFELRDDLGPDAGCEEVASASVLSEDELVARLMAEFDAEEIETVEEGGA